MKTKLSLITITLLALAARLTAGEASVTLTWQARPPSENVTHYIISEELSPGRAILGTTTGTNAVIANVSNGQHTYFVSGVNSGNPSQFYGEGMPSQKFIVNIYNYPIASPGIPAGLTGNVTYTFP